MYTQNDPDKTKLKKEADDLQFKIAYCFNVLHIPISEISKMTPHQINTLVWYPKRKKFGHIRRVIYAIAYIVIRLILKM